MDKKFVAVLLNQTYEYSKIWYLVMYILTLEGGGNLTVFNCSLKVFWTIIFFKCGASKVALFVELLENF